jgi:hypothetical protein
MEVAGEAEDGREALAQCRQLAPDVALLDVRMVTCSVPTSSRRVSFAPFPRTSAGPASRAPVAACGCSSRSRRRSHARSQSRSCRHGARYQLAPRRGEPVFRPVVSSKACVCGHKPRSSSRRTTGFSSRFVTSLMVSRLAARRGPGRMPRLIIALGNLGACPAAASRARSSVTRACPRFRSSTEPITRGFGTARLLCGQSGCVGDSVALMRLRRRQCRSHEVASLWSSRARSAVPLPRRLRRR